MPADRVNPDPNSLPDMSKGCGLDPHESPKTTYTYDMKVGCSTLPAQYGFELPYHDRITNRRHSTIARPSAISQGLGSACRFPLTPWSQSPKPVAKSGEAESKGRILPADEVWHTPINTTARNLTERVSDVRARHACHAADPDVLLSRAGGPPRSRPFLLGR